MPEYSIDRKVLAQMIAAHLSGLENAHPESEDYNIADEVLMLIEELASE